MPSDAVSTYFTADGKAVLRDAQTGKLTTHDPAKAGARIASGRFVPVTEAEAREGRTRTNGGLGETLQTAGEGFVRGAMDTALAPVTAVESARIAYERAHTKDYHELERLRGEERALPTGGKFLENLSTDTTGEYAKDARARAEAHPLAAGAGALAGSLATGGALVRGAAALGEGTAAVTGSRALGAATEGVVAGGAFGTAAAPEEAYIKNEDLTAESVLASMGLGAVLGGGLGLAARGAGELFSKARAEGAAIEADSAVAAASRKEADRVAALSGELPAAAAGEAEQGPVSQWLRKFSEERTTKALGARGSDIRKLGRTAEAAESEMHRMSREVLDYELEDGTKVFKALQSKEQLAENVAKAEQEVGAKLGGLRQRVNSYIEEKAPALKPNAVELADKIQDEIAAPLMASAVPDVAVKAKPVSELADAVRSLGPETSLENLTKIRQDIDTIIYPKPTGPGLPPMPPAHAQELVKVRQMVEEQIAATMDKALEKMGGSELGQYQKLKGQFRAFREANQIAGKAQLQDLGNRVVSPSDYLVGGAVLAGDMATGGGMSAIKAALATGAHHALREHGSAMLAVLADKLADRLEKKVSTGVGDFFSHVVQNAPRPANDLLRMKPSSAAAKRAAIPAALEMFRGKHQDNVAAYRARYNEITSATQNFGSAIRENTSGALGGLAITAPRLSGKVVTQATRAAVFLETKLPTPPMQMGSLTPNAARPIPSDFEIQTFARYWSAVANPLTVVRDLQRGEVTREQVEALQVVYPQLYNAVREKVLEQLRNLDEKGIQVPYQASLQLDLLLNLNGAGEPTAQPAFMARFQQMSAAQQQEQQKQAAPKPVKLTSRLTAGQEAATLLP